MDATNITAVKADVFGSKNVLGEDKIGQPEVGFIGFDATGKRTELPAEGKFESGKSYVMQASVINFTDNFFNYKNDAQYTVDNTTLKVTINGKPAKIVTGAARNILCEQIIKMGGEVAKYEANTKVSAADGKHAGYGYVDLGLPSGTKWATCNIGAAKPEAYGSFFAAGETKAKTTFTQGNFSGYGAMSYKNPYELHGFATEDEKYSIHTKMAERLRPEFDAARQNMGGEWSIPTRLQCKELFDNTTAKYIVVNGVKGTLYTSTKNGKSIFIPYAGQQEGSTVNNRGEAAVYLTANLVRLTNMFLFTWGSSNYETKNAPSIFSQYTYMHEDEDPGGYPSYVGHSVRAVWGGNEFKNDKEIPAGAEVKKVPAKKNSKGGLKGLLNKGKGLLGL